MKKGQVEKMYKKGEQRMFWHHSSFQLLTINK